MSSDKLSHMEEFDLALARNEGLAQSFYLQALKNPSSVAIIDENIEFTYGELHSRAAILAQRLHLEPFELDEPVGIVVQHGVADILTQMAILYAGGTCVPMDSTLPDPQIQGRLQILRSRYVLIDKASAQRDLPFRLIAVGNWRSFSKEESRVLDARFPMETSLDHRTHLIHTSGTTSEPKAVQIAARSILQVVFHAPFEPLLPTDTVAHVNNTSFDVSLFDIWSPLLRGARIAVLRKAVLLDPPFLAAQIDRLHITVMVMTATLLNLAAYVYPNALSKLRVCIFGGEVANISAIKTIMAARRRINSSTHMDRQNAVSSA